MNLEIGHSIRGGGSVVGLSQHVGEGTFAVHEEAYLVDVASSLRNSEAGNSSAY